MDNSSSDHNEKDHSEFVILYAGIAVVAALIGCIGGIILRSMWGGL